MKFLLDRIKLKILIKIFVVIILAFAAGYFILIQHDSQLSGTRKPYIQMLTSKSVLIHWITEDDQPSIVHFGKDSRNLDAMNDQGAVKKIHSVKLENLQPATQYYYHIGKKNDIKTFDPDKHWFYTPSEQVVPTRIWVIGDSGKAGEILYNVRDAALAWMDENPLNTKQAKQQNDNYPAINVWLALGDNAYDSGANDEFQSSLFEPFENILANTVLWPVYGNHDDRRRAYFKIFTLPENAEVGGLASHTENYYSFDYSNVHFVMLDSQASDRSATGEMASWLKQDLANNAQLWVIAAFHHPPYSKGSHDSDDSHASGGRMLDMRKNILPLLEQGGVDMVLSGHSHVYERSYLIDCAYDESSAFSKRNIVATGVNHQHQEYIKSKNKKGHQGAVYVVAGSSAKVGEGPLGHPVHHKGLLEAGSMVIDINNNELVARFINEQEQVRDQFRITKDDAYVSEYPGCIESQKESL